MRRLGRWVLGLLLVIAGAVAALYGYTAYRFNHRYEIASRNLTIPTDSAALERGHRLATTLGKCGDCHADDFGGKVFIDGMPFAYLATPNLTGGTGSQVASWSPAQWDQAIRHGIGPDQRSLVIMPSDSYQYLTDEDAAALIAYLKTLPKVDRELPARQLGPVARGLFAAGKLPIFEGAKVAHDSVGSRPPMGEGEYLARTTGCYGCHGPNLTGGLLPGEPPEMMVPAANISTSGMINWTLADFATLLRTGKRPDGSQVNDRMPWKYTAAMTDGEIAALWNYLRSTGTTSSGS
jgi:mono/diheme cytochrome c family protein